MNTKEIASAVNKDERSIRRWIKKASDKMSGLSDKMSNAERTKTPADYTLEETCFIIEQGLGKNAAEIFKMNALSSEKKPLTIETRMDRMESMLEKLIILMSEQSLVKIESVFKEKQLTLPIIKEKSKRAELREIINKYTAYRRCNHVEVWSQLYQQIYYRMSINVQTCASNRGIDKLDYLESEGLLDEVIALANKLFEVK